MLLGNIGEPKTVKITKISKNMFEFIWEQKKYNAELKDLIPRLKDNNRSINEYSIYSYSKYLHYSFCISENVLQGEGLSVSIRRQVSSRLILCYIQSALESPLRTVRGSRGVQNRSAQVNLCIFDSVVYLS